MQSARQRLRGPGVLGVLAALLLAACGAPATTSIPSPTTTVATPSAEPTAAAAPTVEAPATAEAPPTAASPTPPSTDAPASTATPEAVGFAPIVHVTGGNLLGGVQGSGWITTEVAAPLVAGGEQYRIVTDGVLAGTGQGSTARPGEIPCDWTYAVDVSGADASAFEVPLRAQPETLAVGGEWNLFPQQPKEVDTELPVYRDAVAAELRARGIAEPTVRITRIIRADLEGDGVDEVLLSATFYRDAVEGASVMPNAAAGDYSLVLLRRVVNGEVATVPLAEEFYTEDKEFVAPQEHRLVGAIDLNGDGALEVVVHSHYYEGFSLAVLAVNGTTFEVVLQEGCGV